MKVYNFVSGATSIGVSEFELQTILILAHCGYSILAIQNMRKWYKAGLRETKDLYDFIVDNFKLDVQNSSTFVQETPRIQRVSYNGSIEQY